MSPARSTSAAVSDSTSISMEPRAAIACAAASSAGTPAVNRISSDAACSSVSAKCRDATERDLALGAFAGRERTPRRRGSWSSRRTSSTAVWARPTVRSASSPSSCSRMAANAKATSPRVEQVVVETHGHSIGLGADI